MKNKKQNLIKTFILILIYTTLAWLSNNVFAEPKIISTFCNNWWEDKNILVEVEWWKEKELCIDVWNYWDVEWTANLYFVDWWTNPSTPEFIGCADEWDEKDKLAKYVHFESLENKKETSDKLSFDLPPWKKQRIKWKINFPAGFSWMSYWCLITTVWTPKSVPWMITVVLRRWNIIKARVWWEIKIWLNIFYDKDNFHWSFDEFRDVKNEKIIYNNDKIALVKIDWKIYLRTKIENTWNVRLNTSIIADISNIFGYSFKINSNDVLLPWNSRDIEIPVEKLPFYDWKYNFNIEIAKTPIFEFKSDLITEEMKKETKESFNWSFFIFPIMILVYSLIIAWIIFIIIFYKSNKKKKLESLKKEYKVLAWDTINSIAEKFWCKWDQITELNWINPPYNIDEWMKLIVYDFNSEKK